MTSMMMENKKHLILGAKEVGENEMPTLIVTTTEQEAIARTQGYGFDRRSYYSFMEPTVDYPSQSNLLRASESVCLDHDLVIKLYHQTPGEAFQYRVSGHNNKHAFKNLVVLGLAFMFVFTAFVSLQSLQSTLNAQSGVGVASLCSIYTMTVVSCIIAPTVIRHITTKWSIVVAFSLFLLYVIANVYPRGFTLIPAAILLGLITGPLWSAQSTYLTTLALRHAQENHQLYDTTLICFNGIFGGLFQTSHIWGHILTAVILSTGANNITSETNMTTMMPMTSVPSASLDHVVGTLKSWEQGNETANVCGACDCGVHDFLDWDVRHQLMDVDYSSRNILLGIHIACTFIGVILTAGLLDSNEVNVDFKRSLSMSSQQLFVATLGMLHDYRLLLLLPLIIFTGLEQGFVFGDFTKSYVNCELGIDAIGTVMICFGAVTSLSSFAISYVSRQLKRFPIMVSGALFHTGLFVALLCWQPKHDDPAMFYVISACLGMCDAIWQTQTNALFGLLFSDKQEAAFASYRMLQAVGFAVAYGYSYFLCVHTKLYIMVVVLLVGLLLYSVIERKLYIQSKQSERFVIL